MKALAAFLSSVVVAAACSTESGNPEADPNTVASMGTTTATGSHSPSGTTTTTATWPSGTGTHAPSATATSMPTSMPPGGGGCELVDPIDAGAADGKSVRAYRCTPSASGFVCDCDADPSAMDGSGGASGFDDPACSAALLDQCGKLFPIDANSNALAVDSGTLEAGPIDAGTIDAGTIEAGPIDAGPIEAGE